MACSANWLTWTGKEDESNLIGIAGRHPVRESSEAFGNEILEYTMKTLIAGIEKEYKTIKKDKIKNISIGKNNRWRYSVLF